MNYTMSSHGIPCDYYTMNSHGIMMKRMVTEDMSSPLHSNSMT